MLQRRPRVGVALAMPVNGREMRSRFRNAVAACVLAALLLVLAPCAAGECGVLVSRPHSGGRSVAVTLPTRQGCYQHQQCGR
jgi:hypothetical protein